MHYMTKLNVYPLRGRHLASRRSGGQEWEKFVWEVIKSL